MAMVYDFVKYLKDQMSFRGFFETAFTKYVLQILSSLKRNQARIYFFILYIWDAS